MATIKKQQQQIITSVGEDMDKLAPYIAVGNLKWCRRCEKTGGFSES